MPSKNSIFKIIALALCIILGINYNPTYSLANSEPRSRIFEYGDYTSPTGLGDFDNKTITGFQVKQLMYSDYKLRTVIVIQTKELRNKIGDYAFNYGALLTTDGYYSNRHNNQIPNHLRDNKDEEDSLISSSPYIIAVSESIHTPNVALRKNNKKYTGKLSYRYGLLNTSGDIYGTLDHKDMAYISEASEFKATYIENEYDGVIGVYLKEIDYKGIKAKNKLSDIGKVQETFGVSSKENLKFFDNIEVTGENVKDALNLADTKELAIVVQTKELAMLGENLAFNYGSLLTSDGNSSTSSNLPGRYAKVNSGTVMDDLNKHKNLFITDKSKTACVVRFSRTYPTIGDSLWNEVGDTMFAYTHNTNGFVDTNLDIAGTKDKSNIQYINDKSRFIAVLIKDPIGSIIGIFFREI